MSWTWHRKRPVSRPSDWDTPILPRHEERLAALYGWEQRLRGYSLFPQPVALEPRFVPYDPAASATSYSQIAARPLVDAGHHAVIPLEPPTAQKVTPAGVESLLGSLRGLTHPLSFEIIGSAHEIGYQLGYAAIEAAQVQAVLRMHLPLLSNTPEPATDRLLDTLEPLLGQGVSAAVVDFGLYAPIYQPLQSFSSLAADSHAGLLAALSHLGPGEMAGLQVLLAPSHADWINSLQRLVSQFEAAAGRGQQGAGLNTDPRQALAIKSRSPWWAVVVRVFAISNGSQDHAFALCQRLGQALSVFSEPNGNELVALDDSGYPLSEHGGDLLRRHSRRAGMLLSTSEVAGLVHPPTESLQHPHLIRLDPRERPLPPHLLHQPGVLLGGHPYRREVQPLVWPDDFRPRHAYLLGATRMGKSTLLMHMIEQDLQAGRGLCLIDPHGDLAQDVLQRLPPERVADTLYLDLSDRDFPPALGLLQAGDEDEKRLLVSDLLSIFHRLFASSWGDRLEHILRHVLLTLLEVPDHTLRDIRPLLSDAAYRAALLREIRDPALRSFWHSEFPAYSASTFSPLYNKLGLLLSSSVVRNIVVQPESRLPIPQLMRQKQVILVNLAQGLIGEDNAHFLGALLVSKLQIAAMSSLRHAPDQRVPFTLYVDEFQHFVVSSFARILSEAGKAGLSLVMANQFLEQLNEGLQTAILSNVGTLVSFRVSSGSARRLEREFGGVVAAAELVDLSRGQAIIRLGQGSDSYAIRTLPPSALGTDSEERVQAVIGRTRRLCCRERWEVEAEWYRAVEQQTQPPPAAEDGEESQLGEKKPHLTRPTSKSRTKGQRPSQTRRPAAPKPALEHDLMEECEEEETPPQAEVETESEPKPNEGVAEDIPASKRNIRRVKALARRQLVSTSRTSKGRVGGDGGPSKTSAQTLAGDPKTPAATAAAPARFSHPLPGEAAAKPAEVTPLMEPESFGLAEEEEV